MAETAGFSFAALSELIISVHCMEQDFGEAAQRLRTLDVHEPSSQEFALASAGGNGDAEQGASHD